jgi:hypothetical protein
MARPENLRRFKPDTSAVRVEFNSDFFECSLDCTQCRAFGVRPMLDVIHCRCRDTGLSRKLRLGQPGHRAPGADLVNRYHVPIHNLMINYQVHLTFLYEHIVILFDNKSYLLEK